MPIKKTIKKVIEKVIAKITEKVEDPIYNEYGVCISCQGGDPSCHHNNLAQGTDGTYCTLCNLKVS